MNGVQLDTTSEEKDIGVYVTSDLRPSTHCERATHCETAINTASARLRQIQKNFHYRDRFTFMKLHTICATPPGDCLPCLVPMDNWGQSCTGKSAGKSRENGDRVEGYHLWRKMCGTCIGNTGEEERHPGHGGNSQNSLPTKWWLCWRNFAPSERRYRKCKNQADSWPAKPDSPVC